LVLNYVLVIRHSLGLEKRSKRSPGKLIQPRREREREQREQELLGQFSSTVEQKLYDQDLRNND
jgi:hypothetical protein